MKKIILILSIVALTNYCYSQVTYPDSAKKEFKNIIGIDATGLISQFFNLNTNSYFSYPYYISYRRVFKSNAIRILFGGLFKNGSSNSNDSIGGKNVQYSFNMGLGYEHYSYLSKRWNLYYGMDAIFNYDYNDYQHEYTTTTSSRQSFTAYNCGVSPFLGITFRINSRLSIATETSYEIFYSISESKKFNTPSSSYDSKAESSGFGTNFNAPLAINLRIQL